LQLSDEQEKEVVNIYARTSLGDLVTELALPDAQLTIGLPIANESLDRADDLNIVKLNNNTGEWEETDLEGTVDLQNRRIITILKETGVYGLAEIKPFGTSLDDTRLYPNPFVPDDGITDTGSWSSGIIFDYLTPDSRIRLYTVSGQLVRDEYANGSTWTWDARNESGNKVFSGVYLYIITDGDETKKGKLTVIR
jgi:hypothetical protein